ncbi:MAG: class I tRNA ligase family protein, partial [Actinomycetes bacterium]
VNLYTTEQAPWALAKDPANGDRLRTVIYTIAESLRAIAVLYHPIIPIATESLWGQLGAAPHLGSIEEATIGSAAKWGILPPGALVTKGLSLFPRLDNPAREGDSARGKG